MLIFGPYYAIPKDESFIVYNFSSPTQAISRLPGLFISPPVGGDDERAFDLWYYDYVINDPTACASMMQILQSLYDGNHVYVCIADYINDPLISMVNESFMKLIQVRYDIKYSIINEPSDYEFIPKDGCDFMSVDGIYNFDADRKRFMILSTEENIARGNFSI